MTILKQGDLLGERRAEWSECEVYRYTLERYWDGYDNVCVFVMLNPSVATENKADPTNRRTINFARDWGYSGVIAVNLFAFRATKPDVMKQAEDPVGPENDEVLKRIVANAAHVVFAWGVHGDHRDRDLDVVKLLKGIGPPPVCLRFSKDGHPCHPLMIPRDQKLTPYACRGDT